MSLRGRHRGVRPEASTPWNTSFADRVGWGPRRLRQRSSGSKMKGAGANAEDPTQEAQQDPPVRSGLPMGLANAWPSAELMDTLRDGAADALDLLAAGDVVGARKRWAEIGGMLSRRPKGSRGVQRLVTHAGRSQSISAWGRELGWTPQALTYRIEVMPLDVALVPRRLKM